MATIPDKNFFKIGEVAEIVGVKPHVLRYWETEFKALAPKKTRGSHRHYSRKNVELAVLIRRLVHDEGYTLAGARRWLRDNDQHRKSAPSDPQSAREMALRAELLALRSDLSSFLKELDDPRRSAPVREPAQVTVTKVVETPATVRRRR